MSAAHQVESPIAPDLIAAYWLLVSASHYVCLRAETDAHTELCVARGLVLRSVDPATAFSLADDGDHHAALSDRHLHIYALERRKLAAEKGIALGSLSDVASGRSGISESIAEAFGFVREVKTEVKFRRAS